MDLVLLHLHENQGQIVTRQTLSEQAWLSNHTSDDSINRGVSRLRKLLSKKRDIFIKTVPKQGYLFTLPENCQFTINNGEQPPNAPEPTAEQNPAVPQISSPAIDVAAAAKSASGKPLRQKPIGLISAAIIVAAIALITMIGIKDNSPFSGLPMINKAPKQTTLPIKLAAIAANPSSVGQAINETDLIALHNQLKTELQLNNKFDFTAPNNASNTYVIKIDVTQ